MPDICQSFTVQEVAGWQIPGLATSSERRATLPALQRGFVWKAHQVELLWDSLLRGFPVGSLLLSLYDDKRGQAALALRQGSSGNSKSSGHSQDSAPAYHLLDGQQRATAMALGFYDPWSAARAEGYEAVLWVDLLPPPEGSDRHYVFRLLTRSHPWGYRREQQGQPLSSAHIRQALKLYATAHPLQCAGKRPSALPLTHVWPHDATLPLPVPLLIDCVGHDDWRSHLRARLEKLGAAPWQRQALATIDAPSSAEGLALQQLCAAFRQLLHAHYRIPAQVLTLPAREEKSQGPDPVETLFVRINQGGTKLDNEELFYSLLKAAWVEAPQFIEKLRHRMAPPARLVLLATRLALADQSKNESTMPQTPSVARFRQLVRDDTELSLRRWFEGQERVFERAKALLEADNFGLPTVLSAHLFRTPDVALVLLRWLQRLERAGIDSSTLSDAIRRNALGLCTALQWFAPDVGTAARALWEHLHHCTDAQLHHFWNAEAMQACLALQRGRLSMIPLPTPQALEQALWERVCPSSLLKEDAPQWSQWHWEQWAGSTPGNIRQQWDNMAAADWQQWLQEHHNENEDTASQLDNHMAQAWRHFAVRLWNVRPLLIYAQRDVVRRWFPDYDPSLPQRLEDTDCPWDYDHIHPSNYVTGRWNMPQIIKDWHGSISNFRLWPLEANRSDQDGPPRLKLEQVTDMEHVYDGMSNGAAERRASAIGEDSDWPFWRESTPPEAHHVTYLADPAHAHCRLALLRAIALRTVNLYAEWYDCLQIHDFFDLRGKR